MTNDEIRNELIELIQSDNYDLVQQINDNPEEPYEGCAHSLLRALEDEKTIVEKLSPSDSQARENSKTYKVKYDTMFGKITLVIWDI